LAPPTELWVELAPMSASPHPTWTLSIRHISPTLRRWPSATRPGNPHPRPLSRLSIRHISPGLRGWSSAMRPGSRPTRTSSRGAVAAHRGAWRKGGLISLRALARLRAGASQREPTSHALGRHGVSPREPAYASRGLRQRSSSPDAIPAASASRPGAPAAVPTHGFGPQLRPHVRSSSPVAAARSMPNAGARSVPHAGADGRVQVYTGPRAGLCDRIPKRRDGSLCFMRALTSLRLPLHRGPLPRYRQCTCPNSMRIFSSSSS
jgi:hypothetical protein